MKSVNNNIRITLNIEYQTNIKNNIYTLYKCTVNCFHKYITVCALICKYSFTLLFVNYFHLVAGAFILMNVLKQFHIRNLWKQHIILVNLNVFSLLVGSVICLWVILKFVTETESIVFNAETWLSITVRESFSSLITSKSGTRRNWSQLVSCITVVLPIIKNGTV